MAGFGINCVAALLVNLYKFVKVSQTETYTVNAIILCNKCK